jgi:hypothetical protein
LTNSAGQALLNTSTGTLTDRGAGIAAIKGGVTEVGCLSGGLPIARTGDSVSAGQITGGSTGAFAC